MTIEWSDEDEKYIVTVRELPGCMTHGATYEEAVQQGQDAIDSWIAAAKADNDPVPAPRLFDHEESSRCWRDASAEEAAARAPVAAAGA
jgi:predicted RNase H-like HicB family nuclease